MPGIWTLDCLWGRIFFYIYFFIFRNTEFVGSIYTHFISCHKNGVFFIKVGPTE